MKIKSTNSKIIQKWISKILKQLRLGELSLIRGQLEEAKREIEELKAPKKAKQGNKLLNIGKDKSKAQIRPQQHLSERRKIVSNYQLIDIFLATMIEQDITFEFTLCLDTEAVDLKSYLIQKHNPEYNHMMNNNTYVCDQCNPQKIYKSRACFKKHIDKHN